MKRNVYITPALRIVRHTAQGLLFSSGVHGSIGAKQATTDFEKEDDYE